MRQKGLIEQSGLFAQVGNQVNGLIPPDGRHGYTLRIAETRETDHACNDIGKDSFFRDAKVFPGGAWIATG
jgi:hypothetical protein